VCSSDLGQANARSRSLARQAQAVDAAAFAAQQTGDSTGVTAVSRPPRITGSRRYETRRAEARCSREKAGIEKAYDEARGQEAHR